MAAEAVLGAFVTVAVEQLLEKIVYPELADFFRSKKLDVSLLDKLETSLLSLQAVLYDAEEKQIKNPAIKKWLQKLGDAVADGDNLFDEINTKALQRKMRARLQSQTATTKVRNILSSTFKRPYGEINSKMHKLLETLEHLRAQNLGLKEGVSSSAWLGTPINPVPDVSDICGREDDQKILKGYLLSEDDSGSGSKLGVISIVGMGGLGKSTLAKLLYNDQEVCQKFDLKGWAYITKDFDDSRIIKELLESLPSTTVPSKGNDSNYLNTLQVALQQRISHQRVLIVLDDVWDGNYVRLRSLMDIFNAGKVGSKVIITTRDDRIVRQMQTFLPIHHLSLLESEDCWSLLAKHAFGGGNHPQQSHLQVIGKEIAKKCDGLPLAAIALGGLLRTNLSRDHWNKVLQSDFWNLDIDEVQPALLLSYHYLPAPLKGCFAYCSIFPKKSKLEKTMVIQLWIAEGLLHKAESERGLEDVGEEYFDELVSRSLIHRRSVDGKASFEMHDLNNDLATMVSSAYCVRFDKEKPRESVRHLSYNRGEYDTFDKFESLQGLKGLRTFLALPLKADRWGEWRYLSSEVIHDLLPKMKQLRALSLSGYVSITKLPDSIGNLIYLRYLNLSCTEIESLPSATCMLYNLQTLLLSGCRSLTKLPEDIGKLVNLRHLDISQTFLKEVPAQIATLENLETLSDFVVSKGQDGMKVAELRKFPHLRGKLAISRLQNVTDPSDAVQANLKMKEQIDELELKWDYREANNNDMETERLVLERLEPSKYVKKLTIWYYGGVCFPNWLGDSSFDNMVYLNISDCRQCSSLPSLGQLRSLKELLISNMKSVKSVGAEFYGSSSSSSPPFPSLEILDFRSMPEWEKWDLIEGNDVKEFPSLRRLCIERCPKLKGKVPRNIGSLTDLVLEKCDNLLMWSGHSDNDNTSDDDVIRPPLDIFRYNSLRYLSLYGFPTLSSFPIDGLSKTLQSLYISGCPNLKFLPDECLQNFTSLEYLSIDDSCDSMESFALGSLPVLKSLSLYKCRNLKLVSTVIQASLSFLQSIHIINCNELESFRPGGLPNTPNLIRLYIRHCDKLETLAEPIHTLTGLQDLTIINLPNLKSFATDGLPVNLRQLWVSGNVGAGNININALGLQRLTCLSSLVLHGCEDMVKALVNTQVPLLPTSLESLHFFRLQDIKCLEGRWLQHLTSLREIYIRWCDNLESLPKEGFPPSLKLLSISECPLLKERHLKKRGKEWAHNIPFIYRDRKQVSI